MEEERQNMDLSKKYTFWLIPALCVMIIFGVVFLFAKNKIMKLKPSENEVGQEVSSSVPVLPSANLLFSLESLALKKGEKATVDLILNSGKETKLDGLDVILSFDPKVVEISEAVAEKVFSYSFVRKQDLGSGKLSATFVEEKGDGVLLSGEEKILQLTLTGRSSGTSEITIVKQEKGATTVITESGTSKKLLFDNNSLKVTVD